MLFLWPPADEVHLRGAAVDLEINPDCFDLTTPAGFVNLGFSLVGCVFWQSNDYFMMPTFTIR